MTVQIAIAGTNARGASEKNATPLGSDKTPAPIMLFARLNVEAAILASPPFDFFTSFTGAAASRLRKTLDFLCLTVLTGDAAERTFSDDANAKPDALVAHRATKSKVLKRMT